LPVLIAPGSLPSDLEKRHRLVAGADCARVAAVGRYCFRAHQPRLHVAGAALWNRVLQLQPGFDDDRISIIQAGNDERPDDLVAIDDPFERLNRRVTF
jgi:hypothetical protein